MKIDPQVAAAFGVSLPVTEAQAASFMAAKPLLATPPDYNNFGYELLGMVVARKRGMRTFYDAIKTTMLDRLAMHRTRPSASMLMSAYNDEARYHRSSEQLFDLVIDRSVMTADQPVVPDVHGNINLDNMVAAGGLSSAAVDQARLIAAINKSTANPVIPRAAALAMLTAAASSGLPRAGHGFDGVAQSGTTFECSKGGYIWTSQNGIQFTLDGIGVAVCYNGVSDAILVQRWATIYSAITNTAWAASTDYFFDYGMPPL